MISVLKTLPPKELFEIGLFFIRQISSCVVEDYQLSGDTSNHEFLKSHFSKTKVKELRATIRRNLRFLTSLLHKEEVDFIKLTKLKQELVDWHKILIQQHMYRFTQHTELQWNYLGLCLHYLFDAFHHLYNRLILMQANSSNTKCPWCEADLNRSFSEIISEIITHHLPLIYLLLSLAQDLHLGDDDLNEVKLKTHLDNMKFLVQVNLNMV